MLITSRCFLAISSKRVMASAVGWWTWIRQLSPRSHLNGAATCILPQCLRSATRLQLAGLRSNHTATVSTYGRTDSGIGKHGGCMIPLLPQAVGPVADQHRHRRLGVNDLAVSICCSTRTVEFSLLRTDGLCDFEDFFMTSLLSDGRAGPGTTSGQETPAMPGPASRSKRLTRSSQHHTITRTKNIRNRDVYFQNHDCLIGKLFRASAYTVKVHLRGCGYGWAEGAEFAVETPRNH